MADWKELLTFIDRYDVLARLVPAGLLLLPAVAPYVLLVGDALPVWAVAVAGLLLLYVLSLLGAGLGRRYQAALWPSQGGAPSTRLCRWADDRIEKCHKEQIHAAVQESFQIALHSARKEPHRTEEADRLIVAAFDRVREVLRKRDPNGLWFRHLIEYGFVRNSLAGTGWVALAWLASAATCGIVWAIVGGALAVAGLVLGLAFGLAASLVRYRYRDAIISHHGERYALAAWNAFLSLDRAKATDANNTAPTGH